jgi:hypothetical protein
MCEVKGWKPAVRPCHTDVTLDDGASLKVIWKSRCYRRDSRSVRNHPVACILAVVSFFGSTLTSSPAQEDANIMKSITVDCSAFKKEADGKWTTSRQSVLTGPGGSASGPVSSFPGLNLEMLRHYGVSMIDLLNRKCSR